jgi:hypothetical protein
MGRDQSSSLSNVIDVIEYSQGKITLFNIGVPTPKKVCTSVMSVNRSSLRVVTCFIINVFMQRRQKTNSTNVTSVPKALE